jgi:anaerobic magnesium-protoporphyrin IX monomethyl ester cyclase
MRILLVRPVSDTYIISPPIGLGYIAASLRRDGFNPAIIDCAKERFTLNDFRGFIEKFKADVVGFQVWSCDVPQVEQSLKIVKELNQNTITIIGGAHPSGNPRESLEHFQEADFAFRGEGEEGVALLARRMDGDHAIEFGSIPGLIWRSSNGDVKYNRRSLVTDLDMLGMPAWDLIPPAEYPNAPHQGFAKAFPVAPIITTRGCPFNCTFCASHSINGRKVRFRTIDHVLEEIELLQHKYGVREFHIEDDNFTISKKFVKEFCLKLKERNVHTYWHCSSGMRLDSLDNYLLRLMKGAGCYTFTVAIESGSDRVLKLMEKKMSTRTVCLQVNMMNSAGYKPTGLFMIGFPGETRSEIRKTIRFARSLPIKRAQFAIFHPMPGSKVWTDLEKQGRLKNLDWRKVKPSEVAYSGDIPERELKRFQRNAFLSFHLRPRILWYQLQEINSWQHFKYLIKRVFSMLF